MGMDCVPRKRGAESVHYNWSGWRALGDFVSNTNVVLAGSNDGEWLRAAGAELYSPLSTETERGSLKFLVRTRKKRTALARNRCRPRTSPRAKLPVIRPAGRVQLAWGHESGENQYAARLQEALPLSSLTVNPPSPGPAPVVRSGPSRGVDGTDRRYPARLLSGTLRDTFFVAGATNA